MSIFIDLFMYSITDPLMFFEVVKSVCHNAWIYVYIRRFLKIIQWQYEFRNRRTVEVELPMSHLLFSANDPELRKISQLMTPSEIISVYLSVYQSYKVNRALSQHKIFKCSQIFVESSMIPGHILSSYSPKGTLHKTKYNQFKA